MQTDLDRVEVDVSVILGQTIMPVHKLLRMGRGAVIELTSSETDVVDVMANGHIFARGQVIVSGTRIQLEITELLRRPVILRERGVVLPPREPDDLAA